MIMSLEDWQSKTADEKQQFLISNRYFLQCFTGEDKKKPLTHVVFEKYSDDVKILIPIKKEDILIAEVNS